MRITFRQFAGQFTKFAHDAFARHIGNRVKFTLYGLEGGPAVLISAAVDQSGAFVDITIELSRDVFPNAYITI